MNRRHLLVGRCPGWLTIGIVFLQFSDANSAVSSRLAGFREAELFALMLGRVVGPRFVFR